MAARLHSSLRAREELISLIEGSYPQLRARMSLIKQATRLIVEEALGGGAGDAIGRDYYELGRSSRRRYQPPITRAARRLCASSRSASWPTTAERKTQWPTH